MDDKGTQVPGQVADDGQVLPGTPAATTPPERLVPEGTDYAALQKRLDDIEGRLNGVPDPDAIVKKVVQHPDLKKSQRQMIEFQVQQQMQREIEARTEAIDVMEEAGEISPDVAVRRRKEIQRQVKQGYAKQTQRDTSPESEERQPEVEAQPNPYQTMVENEMRRRKITLNDLPEIKAKVERGIPVPADEAMDAIIAFERSRATAEGKAAGIREHEEKTAPVLEAEALGAGKAPPEGGSVSQQAEAKKRYAHSGRIGEYLAATQSEES